VSANARTLIFRIDARVSSHNDSGVGSRSVGNDTNRIDKETTMKKLILAVPVAAILVGGATVPSKAAVNCGIINKDLERGRAPEDIAERMGVAVGEVKECKAKGPNATTDAPGAKPEGAPSPKSGATAPPPAGGATTK
jgi:hypothetical protein